MDTWDISSLDVQPHHPEVLRSDDEVRVIAINLPAGEVLREHRVHERAYVVVVAGEIEFEQDGRSESGGPGLVAHFPAGEDHAVRAKSDARVVLLLAPWPGEGHPSLRERPAP
ncbi:MAG: cupin domain-containing protein [Thermoleophilaceae bacterium]|nr:cupin domain-containing protein [Thermoleophilaceae bacterium]